MKYILLPFSYLYGIIVFFRNLFYSIGILPSKKFKIPVIGVGNLVTGGTGKTPVVEYLVRLLMDRYKPAVLSRGYKRSTKGFMLATENAATELTGDEARQMKSKFKNVAVAVCENRVRGIRQLLLQDPEINVVILDDAFQHRQVRPGLSILLMEYKNISEPQFLLPAGKMREWPFGRYRADIVVVSKTPSLFSPHERKRIINALRLKPYQKIYFSHIVYNDFFPVFTSVNRISMGKKYYFDNNFSILLLTGIEDPSYLEDWLRNKSPELIPFRFPDHHQFTVTDINKVIKIFDNIVNKNKIIVTTEKDATRLNKGDLPERLKDYPLFYIPIEFAFHGDDSNIFNRQILDYVR